MIMDYNAKGHDTKIGSLDLETYADKENGYGEWEVYAAGCAMNDGYKAFYYTDPSEGLTSATAILILDFPVICLTDYIINYYKENYILRHNYTLTVIMSYAHF